MSDKRKPTEEEIFGTASDLVDGGPASVPSEVDLDEVVKRVTEILGVEPEITERDVVLHDIDAERQFPPTHNVLVLP
jgi:hypothetical protein